MRLFNFIADFWCLKILKLSFNFLDKFFFLFSTNCGQIKLALSIPQLEKTVNLSPPKFWLDMESVSLKIKKQETDKTKPSTDQVMSYHMK